MARAKYLEMGKKKRKRGRPKKKLRGKTEPIDDVGQILDLLKKKNDGTLFEENRREIVRIREWLWKNCRQNY